MRGIFAPGSVAVRIILTAVVATAFSFVAVAPANARLLDSFVTAGKAQARWIDVPASPPGATDTQSIELTVQARSALDFNDAAWVTFRGFDSAPPATPPSFQYAISQAGSSGGSVRLVIRFSDGGYGFLRPVTFTPAQWNLADGSGRNWESRGGTRCGAALSYAEMVACHPGTTVTGLDLISDSGWLYNGRFTAVVDNISYGGEVVTKPAPPVLGVNLNVAPVAGKVLARLPEPEASTVSDTDTVDGTTQGLPIGSQIDTRRGTVRLIAVRGKGQGRLQSGKFSGSVFTVGQSKKGKSRGVTSLRLQTSSRKRCNTARRSSSGRPIASTARRRRGLLRKLRGRARGRFLTRGRYSSAIVKGTDWEMSDRCEGTLVRVRKGRVAVRDFRRKRTILVRAGRSYLARAPGY